MKGDVMSKRITGIAVACSVAAVAMPALGATRAVTIRESGYSVRSLSIHRGDTVKWVWHARTSHNVFQIAGPGHFHSPTHSRTGTFKHRFTAAGTYKFQCTYHAKMQMVVKVH